MVKGWLTFWLIIIIYHGRVTKGCGTSGSPPATDHKKATDRPSCGPQRGFFPCPLPAVTVAKDQRVLIIWCMLSIWNKLWTQRKHQQNGANLQTPPYSILPWMPKAVGVRGGALAALLSPARKSPSYSPWVNSHSYQPITFSSQPLYNGNRVANQNQPGNYILNVSWNLTAW